MFKNGTYHFTPATNPDLVNDTRLTNYQTQVDVIKNAISPALANPTEYMQELHNYANQASKEAASRRELSEKIFKRLTDINSRLYVFGGYVRDRLAGIDFSDMDIYVPHSTDVTVITRLLTNTLGNINYHVKYDHSKTRSYVKGAKFNVYKTVITARDLATGLAIDIDLVQSQDPNYDHPYTKLDFDINCLAQKANGEIFSPIPEYQNSVVDAMRKAANRRYTLVSNTSDARIAKMNEKGFISVTPAIQTNMPGPPTLSPLYPPVPEKEEVKMSTKQDSENSDPFKSILNAAAYKPQKSKPKFFEVLAKDAEKGAYRTGATQGIKALKSAVAKILDHEGFEASKASVIMELFETPIGEGLLRMALGYGLMMAPIPGIQENKYAQNLSEELRVSGMAGGMDYAADLAGKFLVPALMEAYQNTPLMENIMGPKEKMRLEDSATIPADSPESIEVDLDEMSTPLKANK